MTVVAQPDNAVLNGLKAIVGTGGWRSPDLSARYFEDPRGRFSGRASLVLLPASTEEVVRIVRLCNETGTGLIPWGGGTGVVAGQLSPDSDAAVIVSLERLNRVREVNAGDHALVAEAGCILENIHTVAGEHGLMFPLSMASKGSCTIGGNLATNAGGIQVLRHGNARDLCLGIEAVLPTGEILSELDPLRKNNTGYDLRHLLIGSEGTLGIITAATLVLKPLDAETLTAFCALETPSQAMALFAEIRQRMGDALSALELMSGFGVDLVLRHFPDRRTPLQERHEWYLLAEIAGPDGTCARAEEALAACLEAGLLTDVAVASSGAQRAALWDLREHMPAANRAEGAICNSDTSVPVSRIEGFIGETHAAVARIDAGLRTNSYGHVGDGNIHHNVFPPDGVDRDGYLAARPGIIDAVRDAIDRVTLDFGGAISAEHGIGRLKVTDLQRYAAPAKLTALRRIRSALDPNGIMNPGALLP